MILGINYSKWNSAIKPKPIIVAAFSSTNTMEEFEKREAVFEKYRAELIAVFK